MTRIAAPDFLLFGAPTLAVGKRTVPLNGGKPGCLLALLLLDPSRWWEHDQLISAVWPSDAPETAVHALHVHMGVQRRVLRSLTDLELIESRRGAYRAGIARERVDLHRFQRLVEAGRRALAEDELDAASTTLAAAAALRRRGELVGGLPPVPFVMHERAKVRELDQRLLRARAECSIRLDRPQEAVRLLEAGDNLLTRDASQWVLLVRAHHLSGDRDEALDTCRAARRSLEGRPGADLVDISAAEAAVRRDDRGWSHSGGQRTWHRSGDDDSRDHADVVEVVLDAGAKSAWPNPGPVYDELEPHLLAIERVLGQAWRSDETAFFFSMVSALKHFCLVRGHLVPGLRWLELALSTTEGSMAQRAAAHHVAARIAIELGALHQARTHLDQSDAVAAAADDALQRAWNAERRALIAAMVNDDAEQEHWLTVAEDGFRRFEDSPGRTATLIQRAYQLLHRDDERAVEAATTATRTARENLYVRIRACADLALADVQARSGHGGAAAVTLTGALNALVEIDDRPLAAQALSVAAVTFPRRRDLLMGAATALRLLMGAATSSNATYRTGMWRRGSAAIMTIGTVDGPPSTDAVFDALRLEHEPRPLHSHRPGVDRFLSRRA